MATIRKKIVSAILVLGIMTTYASAAYMPKGPTTYDLDSEYCISDGGDTVDGTAISVSDGSGSIKYNFYLPFDCQSFTIKYEASKDVNLTIKAQDCNQTIELSKDLVTATQKFSKVLRRGETEVEIIVDANVEISQISLGKAERPGNAIGTTWNVEPARTDYEDAIQSAILIDSSSSVFLVRGQRRYVDNNDIKQTPLMIDGTTYMPARTLALALGYYCEDIPEKSYVLLRKDDKEYVFFEGNSYEETIYEGKEETGCSLKYVNGKAYLPVRYFAEKTGKNVAWSNGLIVIEEDRFELDNIIKNHADQARLALMPFYPAKAESGKTYYVSQAARASDSNDGSYNYPFKTLEQAGKVAQAGDTVIIREGVYRETLTPKYDGTAASPITYKAMEGEEVVISALEEVTEFENYKDNVYTANVGFNLGDGRNMVFYNGEAIAEARYPNGPSIEMSETGEALSSLFPTQGDIHVIPSSAGRIATSATLLDQEDDYWVGGTLVSLHGYGWALCTGKITDSESGKLNIGSSTATRWWFAPKADDKHNFAYITGHINAMDLPGEWVMQDDSLLIIPPEGADPSNMKLEMKARQLVIDIADRKYIRFEGIKTIGGGVRMNESEMCVIDDCELKYISHYVHGLDQRDGYIYTGDIKSSNDAPQKGEVGIFVGGTDNMIINSTIDHSAGAGIYIVGKYAYVDNNVVSNCGYAGSYVSGITFGNELYRGWNIRKGGFTLYNNTVYNCGRSALNIQNPESYEYISVIPYESAYNDFHDGVLFSLDTGITYEYYVYCKTDKQESSHHNNYVYYTGTKTNPYSFAIYHDGGAIGIDTYENMVFTTEPDVIFSQLYIQNAQYDVNIWNNSLIKKSIGGGPEKLSADEFPYGRPFYAGVQDKEYLVNYNRIKNGEDDTTFYKASEAVLSDGLSVDENGLVSAKKDQYICFEDVDFGEAGNNINITYRADKYNTNDCIDIIVGDDMSTGTVYNNNYIYSYSKTEKDDDMISIGLEPVEGKTNVYIKFTAAKSMKVKGISVNDSGRPIEAHDGTKIYGGAYNNVEKVGLASSPPAAVGGPDQVHSYVKDVWPGTILRYKNVVIEEAAKYLQYSIGTTAAYGNQAITVAFNKLGDPGNTTIATFKSPTDGWDKYNTYYTELTQTLEAGTYDIYVTFGKNDKDTGTCNFWFFGFLPEIPTEE